ncbi:MAG: SUMF1/EgtB/PvdO family nonheme iron enzyme [Thermoflexales bacterium]|nr:SUMF1/EgtB/PvdO family nonheme iron enzyme [Thermoflexales bacterium]
MFTFDKTGFPLLFIPDLAIEVHLLPVSKAQFERFIAEQLGGQWAGTSEAAASTGEREDLFMTGVLPEEALAFARWLGEGFDLPSLDEWRAIYRALERQPLALGQPALQLAGGPAKTILEQLVRQVQSGSLLDLALMRGGVLEWVRQGEGNWLGRGQPRHIFLPNLFNPLSERDDQIRPVQLKRSRYFGFRLIRRNRKPTPNVAVTVQAGQHIFTSVEKEQSPHGKEGFQTLFYTQPALSKSEAEDIETRLVYFLSDTKPIDRLFFSISSGKVIVSQIVPLPEADRFGRRGRYLAHSLAFTAESFVQLGADPFSVFEHFPLITDVPTALRSGDPRTGNMGIVVRALDVQPTQQIQAAQGWPAAELKRLSLLALQAGRLAHDRSAVALVGQPEEIQSALQAAFLAVPGSLRLRCTFDTYFYRCNLASTYYWAVGLPEAPNDPRLVVVDARSRQLVTDTPLSPQTAYERWVVEQLETENLAWVAHWKDYAFAVCEWLDGRGDCHTPLVEEAPLDVIDSTFLANASQVQALLHNKLLRDGLLSPGLVECVAEQVQRRMRPVEHYRRLRQGFERSQLAELLYQLYKEQAFQSPPTEQLQELGALVDKVELPALRALYASWSGQRPRLRRELEHLGQEEYREFVQLALHAGLVDDPLALLVPRRGSPFLDIYLASGELPVHGLAALVQALLAGRETDSLARLAAYVPEQPAEELHAMQRAIGKRPDIPPAFRQALDEALRALPPDGAPFRNGVPANFWQSVLKRPGENERDERG